MDEQISALIEATIAQTKAEQERSRLEDERIKIDKERLEGERAKLKMLNEILLEVRKTNENIDSELLPSSKTVAKLMPILLEIQRIVIMKVVSSPNQDEEIRRLKDLLTAMNNDFNISISGDVEKVIGQQKK